MEDNLRLSRSSSISSLHTSNSSWSFIDEEEDENFDLADKRTSKCKKLEGVGNDDDDDDDDDELSVVHEDDLLNADYVDAVKVSKRLEELSRFFDSPFKRLLYRLFAGQTSVRIMVIVTAAVVAVIFFCSFCGVERPKLSFASLESVWKIGEVLQDRYFGPQYRSEIFVPSVRPSIELSLKPSLSWSILPISAPSRMNVPVTWVLQSAYSGGLITKLRLFDASQRDRFLNGHHFMNTSIQRNVRHAKPLKKILEKSNFKFSALPNLNQTLIDCEIIEFHFKKNASGSSEALDIDSLNLMKSKTLRFMESRSLEQPNRTTISKLISPVSPFMVLHVLAKPFFELLTPPLPQNDFTWIFHEQLRRSVDEAYPHSWLVKPSVKKTLMWKYTTNLVEEELDAWDTNDLNTLSANFNFLEEITVKQILKQLQTRNFEKSAERRHVLMEWYSLLFYRRSFNTKYIVISEDNIANLFKELSWAVFEQNRREDRNKQQNEPNLPNRHLMVSRKKLTAAKRSTKNGNVQYISTCNVLAGFTHTLISINLFPTIVGQANVTKYIDSLLNRPFCGFICLARENCWWIEEYYHQLPRTCISRVWKDLIDTKQHSISLHDKMVTLYKKFGQSVIRRNCKNLQSQYVS